MTVMVAVIVVESYSAEPKSTPLLPLPPFVGPRYTLPCTIVLEAKNWSTGMTCTLGQFYPVTEGQVAEIEAVLRAR